jgi:hypothetical protein
LGAGVAIVAATKTARITLKAFILLTNEDIGCHKREFENYER